MEIFQCPHCQNKGHAKSRFDLDNHKFFCGQCRQVSTISPGQASSVTESVANAIKCFERGDYKEAQTMALHAIEIAYNYAPAQYILAYYKEVVEKKINALNDFFAETIDAMPITVSEGKSLMKLFAISPKILLDYERAVIYLIDSAQPDDIMSNQELYQETCNFYDQLLPYLIANRGSHTDLASAKSARPQRDNETVDMESEANTPISILDLYAGLSQSYNIPKTCYALYNAIAKLPDSPCINNSFFLETKTRKFYNDFVLPVGDIIQGMCDPQNRAKFGGAYEKRRAQFEALMNNA